MCIAFIDHQEVSTCHVGCAVEAFELMIFMLDPFQ